MTLRQFEYFASVVETGSFTRAAERLRVTQSALSHQLAALERSLGAPLIVRGGRVLHLTAAGRAALPHARAALAAAAATRRATASVSDALVGEIRLATVYSVSIGVLPRLLADWLPAHPGVDLALQEHRHHDHVRRAVGRGEVDVGVAPIPPDWQGPVLELGDEEFVVVADRADALRHRGEVDLAELSDRRWVHFATDNGLGEVLDAACAAAGFAPVPAVRVEQTASAPALAAAGIGPTLVPANMLPPDYSDRVLRLRTPVRRRLGVFATAGDPIAARIVESMGAERAAVGEP